jgi:hypothetical protein
MLITHEELSLPADLHINYVAEPTLAKFHASNAQVRGVMGPIGSGKSVGSGVLETLSRALRQEPGFDGVRRTRFGVVRNTYPMLKSTTIKTWQEWLPDSVCPIKWDAPINGRMILPLADGTTVDMEVLFVSIDKPKDIAKLLSLELTGVWVNEAREFHDFKMITDIYSRTGRYPSTKTGVGCTFRMMVMDTNPPDDDHWWYKNAEEHTPEGWEFFRQPGALLPVYDQVTGDIIGFRCNPEAENIVNLGMGYRYYTDLVSGADLDWILVYLCGQYGTVMDGRPVYQHMWTDLHVANDLTYNPMIPLYLGWDFGLTPACVVGQPQVNGRLLILDEYYSDRSGIKQFVSDVVRPALVQKYAGARVVSTADPAGEQANQVDATTPIGMMNMLGIPTQKAITNSFPARRQAVIDRLTRSIEGRPALMIDSRCKMLIKGMRGGYQFRRIQMSGSEARYHLEPDKNRYSHPADALQYLILGVDNLQLGMSAANPMAGQRRPMMTRVQENTWGAL